jgi:hypothetical protein
MRRRYVVVKQREKDKTSAQTQTEARAYLLGALPMPRDKGERRERKEMFLLNSLSHWRASLKKLGFLSSFSTSRLMKTCELLRRFSEFDQILYLV